MRAVLLLFVPIRADLPPYLDTVQDMILVLYGDYQAKLKPSACCCTSQSGLIVNLIILCLGRTFFLRSAAPVSRARVHGLLDVCGMSLNVSPPHTWLQCFPFCSQYAVSGHRFMNVLDDVVDSMSPAVAPLPYLDCEPHCLLSEVAADCQVRAPLLVLLLLVSSVWVMPCAAWLRALHLARSQHCPEHRRRSSPGSETHL